LGGPRANGKLRPVDFKMTAAAKPAKTAPKRDLAAGTVAAEATTRKNVQKKFKK
jgi:hypothetical protein